MSGQASGIPRTIAAVHAQTAWLRENPTVPPKEAFRHLLDQLTDEMAALEIALGTITEIAQDLRRLHEKPSCAIGEVGAVIARLDEATKI